jgi:hypothetical protein
LGQAADGRKEKPVGVPGLEKHISGAKAGIPEMLGFRQVVGFVDLWRAATGEQRKQAEDQENVAGRAEAG